MKHITVCATKYYLIPYMHFLFTNKSEGTRGGGIAGGGSMQWEQNPIQKIDCDLWAHLWKACMKMCVFYMWVFLHGTHLFPRVCFTQLSIAWIMFLPRVFFTRLLQMSFSSTPLENVYVHESIDCGVWAGLWKACMKMCVFYKWVFYTLITHAPPGLLLYVFYSWVPAWVQSLPRVFTYTQASLQMNFLQSVLFPSGPSSYCFLHLNFCTRVSFFLPPIHAFSTWELSYRVHFSSAPPPPTGSFLHLVFYTI